MYDVIIIGGGPAAVAAGVYVGRKQLTSLLIAETLSGQSVVSDDIQNWIGDTHISGVDLAKRLSDHARAYADVLTIKEGETVSGVKEVTSQEDRSFDFEVVTDKATYQTRSVIIASGARRRKLGVPGEDAFNGKGVAYCSTCDAPLFKNKDVAVIGGGNAGLEAVQDLLPYAKKIYLVNFDDVIRGDATTFAKIKDEPNVQIISNAATKEVRGDKLVSALVYTDRTSNEDKQLDVQGAFVEIGSVPNSEIVKDLVTIDQHGQIITDMKFATTSHPGVFAAGDVTDDPFKQNNISVGDGVRAALSAYDYLLKRQKQSPAAEVDRHGTT